MPPPKLPRLDDDAVRAVAANSSSRLELWSGFATLAEVARMAEVGVYRGDFAAHLLQHCGGLKTYYMIDPWRQLPDWNKPANKRTRIFRRYLAETMQKTEEWSHKRVVLRGRTVRVAGKIPDESLDFAYIDGDHTLRGITIDLQTAYAKVRPGGWIGGDDFTTTIWQHGDEYEPTLVFPYAVHFAEAVRARLYALPYDQFLLRKPLKRGRFRFVDLTGRYGDVSLASQLARR